MSRPLSFDVFDDDMFIFLCEIAKYAYLQNNILSRLMDWST